MIEPSSEIPYKAAAISLSNPLYKAERKETE